MSTAASYSSMMMNIFKEKLTEIFIALICGVAAEFSAVVLDLKLCVGQHEGRKESHTCVMHIKRKNKLPGKAWRTIVSECPKVVRSLLASDNYLLKKIKVLPPPWSFMVTI